MNVLITGGGGFIGSHLAERLLARGDRVLVVDSFATGRRDNLAPRAKLTVVEGTVADAALVQRLVDGFRPEVVIHAAASYKDPDAWVEDVRTNVLGSANVAAAARRGGPRRLIYFQTALIYGTRPIEQPITLNHPLQPESSYAISKLGGEQYIHLSGIDYVSFRLANVYGPRNLSGPLPTFFHRLMNDQPCFVVDTRRDFLYIDDLVQLVMMAVDGRGERGPYHVASGSDRSIKELFEAVVTALGITRDGGVEVRPRSPDDAYTLLLDPAKTTRDFGWEASTPLETGVGAAVEWYKRCGVTDTYTHLRVPDPGKGS